MTPGEIVFYAGAALLGVTVVLAIFFLIKKPKYIPENSVYAATSGVTVPQAGQTTYPLTTAGTVAPATETVPLAAVASNETVPLAAVVANETVPLASVASNETVLASNETVPLAAVAANETVPLAAVAANETVPLNDIPVMMTHTDEIEHL